VLFAHAIVLLFLLLAHWQAGKTRIGPLRLVSLLVLMTMVVGMRQQGVLFSLVAAVWLATMMKYSRLGTVLVAVALAIAPVALNRVLTDGLQKPMQGPVNGAAVGFKILMHFDLVGMMANQGRLASDAATELVAEVVQQVPLYTPYRVDTLTGVTHWHMSMAELVRIWGHSILVSPEAYLMHRTRLFGALLGMNDVRQCLPVHTGIGGPLKHDLVSEELTAMLGLQPGQSRTNRFVGAAAWGLAATPLLMHWAYLLVLAGLSVVLIRRRAYVLLSLAACSLVFLASYFVLGIACDFRYAYTLTVTTSLLAAWVVLGARHRTASSA